MRITVRASLPCLLVVGLALLSVNCGDDNGSTEPDSVRVELTVLVIDDAVSPPESLFTESAEITAETRYIDLQSQAIIVSVGDRQVSQMTWTSSDFHQGLFAVARPAAVNGVYDIVSIPVSQSNSPAASLSSFALFLLGVDGSTGTDSLELGLELDGEVLFEDSLFVFNIIDLGKAYASSIPLMRQGQTGVVRFSTTDFCANINPDFRDPRNLHTMVLMEGSLSCGKTYNGMQTEKEFHAFFTSLPVE